MAVIGKIRQRSGLVIGLIALSLLAFILTDAFSNNSSLFNNQEFIVGKMKGEKIQYADFDKKVKEYEQNAQRQYGQLSPELQDMIRDQVWETFFRDIVLQKQYKKMHLEVSPEELTWLEFQAPTPHQMVVSYFTNPQTGQVFEQFANPANGQLDVSKAVGYRQNMQPEEEAQWVEFIDKGIMDDAVNKKYFAYVRKGNFVNSLEAKEEYAAANNTLKGQFVALNYNTIVDSTIKVTDAELAEYLQKHPEEFKQEASRKLEYVAFDINASGKDSAEALQWAAEKTKGLKETKNDSAYIVNNGGLYDTNFLRRGNFIDQLEDSMFASEPGRVFGPAFQDGEYIIFKVLATKPDTVAYYRASHILLRPEGATKEDTAAVRKRATDLLAEIRNGKDFADAVKEVSLDPNTNSKGGDLGWFQENAPQLPKNLVDAIAKGSKGDYAIVTTTQGVHIVKITHNASRKMIQVGEIARVIEPSNESFSEIVSAANEFAGSVTNEEQFNKAIEEQGYSKRFAESVKERDRVLGGLRDARKVIMWAFDEEREIGQISQPFEVDENSKLVVARLVSKSEKGTAKVEDVRDRLEEAVRKQKKAEQLKQKLEEAKNGATNLADIATKLGVTVLDVPYQTFNTSTVASAGPAPTLLGYMFGSETKKIQGPVKDNSAVYLFVVESIEEAKLPEKLDDIKIRQLSQVISTSDVQANKALREMADIKDQRYMFY